MIGFVHNTRIWVERYGFAIWVVMLTVLLNSRQAVFAQDVSFDVLNCPDCQVWSTYSAGAVSVASAFFGAMIVLYLRRPAAETRRAKEAERAASLAALFLDSSEEAMVVTDSSGLVLSVNRAFGLVTGYPVPDVVGRNILFLASPRHDQAFYDHILADLQACGHWKGEVWIRHHSGQDRLQWARLNLMPDQPGSASCYVALFYDITEHKQAEIELHQSVSRLNLVLETVGEGILGLDEKERITFANPAAAKFLGFASAEQLLGKNSAFVTHHMLNNGSACGASTCLIRSSLVTGQVNRVSDEFFCDQDGGIFPVQYVVSPLKVDDKIVGAVVAFHSISDLKDAERELKRSNAELEQFAFAVSNDLRQPLRLIVSYLGVIEKRIRPFLDEETCSYFEFSKSGAIKMDQMIASLLEYARVGRGAATLRPVYLPPIVTDAVRNLHSVIDAQQARIVVAENLPTILGDASELLRLFQNLIGNAVKYHVSDVTPMVEIGCKADNNQWVVWVKDNGIGIESKDYDRAFGIFQRLDTGNSCDGTGVGLAVCKKIVDRHGGRIWIESEFGVGTTFYISFPVLAAQV